MLCITIQESKESRKAFFVLKHFTRKLRRAMPDLPSTEADEDSEAAKMVLPGDVKEGHFAVVAVKGGKPKRFILDLSFLENPAFLSLLEQAEEEYGFQKKGPILVPCQPEELQEILAEREKKVASFRGCFFEHGRVQKKLIG